jgi:thiamine phosphate synthase YjbQ (UPF0047 family)
MISQLASPSVCVIDDEEADYRPILDAMNEMFVSTVHIAGSLESLPSFAFDKLRLVFLDLHLSNTLGKDAASHTANVFRKVVSKKTAPVVVVIWSKYASDKIGGLDIPPEDQETEAELFKRTLFEAEPEFKGRLIFLDMAKPKNPRPPEWTTSLRQEITTVLADQPAVDVFWAWESFVRDGCAHVTEGLTTVAEVVAGPDADLKDGLKVVLQHLVKAQGEGYLSAETAPYHLATVLTQVLNDQLEHSMAIAGLATHGTWLSQNTAQSDRAFAAHINSLLMTAGLQTPSASYSPGTVYRIKDTAGFKNAFGQYCATMIQLLCPHKTTSPKSEPWCAAAKPILIELSPACDVAQHYRVSSLLIAGVIVPSSIEGAPKSSEAFGALPIFRLRWPIEGFPEQDVRLLYCHRHKLTLPSASLVNWIEPWFRIRELPLTAVRNSNAAHASRVGFVSMQEPR